ncbi:MAG: hypothetical protein AAFV46_14815, partial [Cyanobacteria bacterium J06635_11]
MAELAELLETTDKPPMETDLKAHFELSQPKISAALEALESAGLIDRGMACSTVLSTSGSSAIAPISPSI